MGRVQPVVRATLALLAATALVAAACLGFAAGRVAALDGLVGAGGGADAWRIGFGHALGIAPFHAGYGQDLWILRARYPDLREGYFVDLGSADGVDGSNTKALERAGWKGLCIDPFPRNMARRDCKVVAAAIDAEGGHLVAFQGAGTTSGGLVDQSGWWVSDADKARSVQVPTLSLAQVLDDAGAPAFIEYLNVDIEGAEYEALRTFPFDRYRFGAITIEHNNVAARRAQLRALLEGHGYRFEWALRDQDWYVLDDGGRGSGEQAAAPL